MSKYAKGANAERELMKVLYADGFAVVRAGGSGVNVLPSPDLLALKKNSILIFECKAWKGNYLYLEEYKIQQLEEFANRSGGRIIIAWKIPHHGWLFIGIEKLKKTKKNFYAISLKEAEKGTINLEVLAGIQKTLQNGFSAEPLKT